MGPKIHFFFALIFFILGRRNGDDIFYFFAVYALIIGVSAMVYRLSLPKQKDQAPDASDSE